MNTSHGAAGAGRQGVILQTRPDQDHHPAAWYAVYTKSRCERVVCSHLEQQGLETFLPERWRWSRRRDRRQALRVPLFPGYLFVRLAPRGEMYLRTLRTPGVVRLLGRGPGGPVPVPGQEVESLRVLVHSRLRLEPVPYLRRGDTVRITRGPLAGARGVVVRRRGRSRLVVAVDIMQRAVAVELDEAALDKAEAA